MLGVPTNTTTASTSWTSPGAGITGGYNNDSVSLKITIALFSGLAMYNSLELMALILLTFRRYKGLYFWSLLLSSLGILPYSLGFMLKYLSVTPGNLRWMSVTFLTIGWYPMITGQALVLWSRLHLIVSGDRGDKIMKYTKWMIIFNAICLHIPTTVLTWGSNGDMNVDTFVHGYGIMEKIQMCGFFCQEVILSSIYIIETARILKSSLQQGTRKMLQQLVLINAVIIIMDLGLLGLEAASLYILETLTKGVIYSIKLKLEFAILGKLVQFVGGSRAAETGRKASVGFMTTHSTRHDSTAMDTDMNVSDFVDLNKVSTNVSYPSRTSGSYPSRRKSKRLGLEYDFARFEHVEDVMALEEEEGCDSSEKSKSADGHV